jgi:hypothetical protein
MSMHSSYACSLFMLAPDKVINNSHFTQVVFVNISFGCSKEAYTLLFEFTTAHSAPNYFLSTDK